MAFWSRKGLWRVTLLAMAPLCVWLVLRWFHRYTDWGRSLSADGYAMVGTTLVAAALGFGAVMLQLADQHRTADETRKEQTRATAAAILFEIDYSCTRYAEFYEEYFGTKTQETEKRQARLRFIPVAFNVYPASADKLGNLGAGTASAVVKFYSGAQGLHHYLQLHQSAGERYRQTTRSFPGVRPVEEMAQVVQQGWEHEAALNDLGFATEQMQRLLQELDGSSQEACRALSDLTSVSYDDLPGLSRLHEAARKYAQTN